LTREKIETQRKLGLENGILMKRRYAVEENQAKNNENSCKITQKTIGNDKE